MIMYQQFATKLMYMHIQLYIVLNTNTNAHVYRLIPVTTESYPWAQSLQSHTHELSHYRLIPMSSQSLQTHTHELTVTTDSYTCTCNMDDLSLIGQSLFQMSFNLHTHIIIHVHVSVYVSTELQTIPFSH